MERHLEGALCGLAGGLAGVALMNVIMKRSAGLVRAKRPRAKDVFDTERSMSLVGVHHRRGEPATEALARAMFVRVTGRSPDERTRKRLARAIHWGFGLTMAAAYGGLAAGGPRSFERTVRNGALFGGLVWLVADELAVPLLGLADKPTAYHPSHHLQALAGHLGFGVATATAARTVGAFAP